MMTIGVRQPVGDDHPHMMTIGVGQPVGDDHPHMMTIGVGSLLTKLWGSIEIFSTSSVVFMVR